MRPKMVVSDIRGTVLRGWRTVFSQQQLPPDFNLATYLARYNDVRDWAVRPKMALQHYLRHGVNEQRDGSAGWVDPTFIADLYGVSLPTGLTASEAPSFLRAELKADFARPIFLTEGEMLSFYKIDLPEFLSCFDHDYYFLCALPDIAGTMNRAQCLKHFCEFGQYRAIDISSDWRFDERFFYDEYIVDEITELTEEKVQLSRKELFRKWIHAKGTPKWPNLRQLVRHNFNVGMPLSLEEQLPRLKALFDISRPSELVRRLIERPGESIDQVRISDDAIALFLTAIADRFATKGEAQIADICYARVLNARPDFGPALRHRADQVHRIKYFGLDAMLRKEIVEKGVANKWTYINLANSLSQIGDFSGAAAATRDGQVAYPGDWQMRTLATTHAYAALNKAILEAPRSALIEGYQVAQKALTAALECATPSFGRIRRGRMISRVAVCGYYALPQCRFYRINLKVDQLEELGLQVETFDLERDGDAYLRRIRSFDLLILHRVPAVPAVIELIAKTSDLGIPTVYDIDDLVFEADCFPPDLSSYAGQIDRAAHAGLAASVPLYAHAMSLCDYGIASTQAIKPFMERRVRSGSVFILPNALSKSHMPFVQRLSTESDKVVIFYGSGTRAHKQDFKNLVEPALLSVLNKHGNKIQILIFGYLEISSALARFKDQITVREPLSDIEGYWEALQGSDINLSVLEPSVFNDCKSEIKWLEAAMMGIPSVVSRTKTYEAVIEDGVTGFLCDSSEDFARTLDGLVSDRSLRLKIGTAAQEEVLQKYSIDQQTKNFQAILSQIENAYPHPKNRLLVVNVFYPPQAIGGATRVVHDNIMDLQKNLGTDWSIDVITTLEGGERPYEISWRVENGVRVFAITAADRSDIDSIVEDPAMGKAFEDCLRLINPTLVHFHCIQRLTVSVVDIVRRRKIPYVITLHDGWWISPNHFILGPNDKEVYYDLTSDSLAEVRQHPLRRGLRFAARITTVSEQFATVCRKAGLHDVVVIENGVSSLPTNPRVPNHMGRVRLAHIGGRERHKGAQLIRNLLLTREFKNLSFLLIDHAFEPSTIAKEIWGNTPVEIRGKTPQSEVASLYASIDVLLAPSIWPESYGLVTREAAAAGCWIVASDRGAIGDCVVPGKNGYIVDVSSSLALEEVLRRIDTDPQTFSRPPEYKVEIRRAQQQAEELVKLYHEVGLAALVAT